MDRSRRAIHQRVVCVCVSHTLSVLQAPLMASVRHLSPAGAETEAVGVGGVDVRLKNSGGEGRGGRGGSSV